MTADKRQITIGLLSSCLGLYAIYAGLSLPNSFSYDGLGSRMLPTIVGAGLLLTALWVTARGFRKQEDDFPIVRMYPILMISAGLTFMYFTIEYLGWIFTATVLFLLVSKAFDDRTPVRSALVGMAMAVSTYVLFSYGLGVDLPVGRLVLAYL